jgi:hypothetical protein
MAAPPGTWWISRPLPMIALILAVAVIGFFPWQSYGVFTFLAACCCAVLWFLTVYMAMSQAVTLLRGEEPAETFLYIVASLVGFVVIFAVFYFHLSHYDPASFNTGKPLSVMSAIYFTVVTFATVGYGDFFPATDLARGIVTVEIILGMLYPVMVFTVVVAWTIQAVQKKPD